jgi:hypothetical protein
MINLRSYFQILKAHKAAIPTAHRLRFTFFSFVTLFSSFFITSVRISLQTHRPKTITFVKHHSHSLFFIFSLLVLRHFRFSAQLLNFFDFNCSPVDFSSYYLLIRLVDFLLGLQALQLHPIDPNLYEFF